MKIRILVLAAIVIVSQPLAAFIPSITGADAERALRIALSPPPLRAAFERPYSIDVNAPSVDLATVDRIEIITEFRRMEKIAEQRSGVDRTFGRAGTDEMLEAIRPWRNQLAVRVELRLDYARTLKSMPPPTDISIDNQSPLKVATSTFGGGRQAPTGAVIEAIFDSMTISSGPHSITVRSDGREVARCDVDFRSFE